MESNLKFSDFMRISLDDNNLVEEELLDTILWKCQCLPYDFCSMNDGPAALDPDITANTTVKR